jgi:tetratricopeptide (TPR) repeat protein
MHHIARVGASCWLLILLGAAAARGQTPGSGTSERGTTPAAPAARVSAPDDAGPLSVPSNPDASGAGAAELEVAALLERAKAHFRAGRYREALPLVERAYALTGAPRALFNLGVLHHKLSECEPAREYFELYLQREPASTVRPQVLVALQELRARCPAGGSAGAAPAPAEGANGSHPMLQRKRQHPRLPAQPLEPDWTSSSALILLGSGAAAGVGMMVSLAAQNHTQRAIDALGSRAARQEGTWDSFEGRRRDLSANARLYRGFAIGFGAACVALVGAGATVWIVETGNGPRRGLPAAGIGYSGLF